MADAVKAVRQGMQQEAPDELVGIERHAFLLAAMAMVTPAECDFAVFHADEPGIGDGDPNMRDRPNTRVWRDRRPRQTAPPDLHAT